MVTGVERYPVGFTLTTAGRWHRGTHLGGNVWTGYALQGQSDTLAKWVFIYPS